MSPDMIGELHPDGWRSIERAPRDGREVLLYSPVRPDGARAPMIWVGYWFSNSKKHDDGWQEVTFGGSPGDLAAPTHWMPLPEDPK